MFVKAQISTGVLLSFVLTSAHPPASSAASQIAPHTYEVGGGIAPGRQPDGNTYILQSGNGLTVIDTGRHASHLNKIEAFAAEKHTSIVAVINTHWHLDHVSGNIGLRKAYPAMKVYGSGAINEALAGFLAKGSESSRKMLATEKLDPVTREEISTDLATIDAGDALKPDVVLSHDETLVIGGRKLQIYVAKDAATAADVWVYDPSSGLVFAGDLLTFPAPFLDTACGDGWKSALTKIEGLPFRTVAPGHGPLLSREQFHTYTQAFNELLSCSASSQTAAACAKTWIDQVADIGRMTDQEKELGQGMTVYYVKDVLRAHGGNSGYCAAKTQPTHS
jgi:glyoxylase-like metal-dependent hydrolase (beta-lactamase superfamily II)